MRVVDAFSAGRAFPQPEQVKGAPKIARWHDGHSRAKSRSQLGHCDAEARSSCPQSGQLKISASPHDRQCVSASQVASPQRGQNVRPHAAHIPSSREAFAPQCGQRSARASSIASTNDAPQSGQRVAPSGISSPQLGHARTNTAPHAAHDITPASRAAPHVGQRSPPQAGHTVRSSGIIRLQCGQGSSSKRIAWQCGQRASAASTSPPQSGQASVHSAPQREQVES